MNTINSYLQGLDKDTSPMKYSNQKYYHLENFRIVTAEGSSTAALENEKGNRLDFQIPSTQGVYKIPATDINLISILIQGPSDNPYYVGLSAATLTDFYNDLVSNPDIAAVLGQDFNVYLQDEYILFVGLDYLNITELDNNNLLETLVEPQENLRIIHLNYIDSHLIVFTTGNNGDGQIWYVNYNEQLNEAEDLSNGFLVPSIHLKYNGQLNLSTEVAINKSIVRKETSKICRIYWTDNFNPTRRFNLFDPNGFAFLPTDLDLTSDVTFDKPIIKDISEDGSIPYGAMVQFGYVLVASGKETIVSPLSDILPMIQANDETSPFKDMDGTPYQTGSGKSVTYTINNVDTDYEQIKHIAILYELQNTPVITVFKTENILSESIDVVFTNDEEPQSLTEQDINNIKAQWTVCKSLTSQNNRLIVANTKAPNFEVTDEQFDSRAYRYKTDQTALIKDKLGNTLIVPSDFEVPFEHDAINPFNNVSDVDYGEYKYQSDGTTLGGEGANIKYKFVTQSITLDNDGTSDSSEAPFSFVANRETVGDAPYSFNNQFNHFKSPFIHFLYGGYMRDEIYRFAIVFKSKKGLPSFAKWIGDIKFPSIKEYPLEQYSNGTLESLQLGIEFDVTIPTSLQDQISGYEIVRVNRDFNNRTVITGGLFDPLVKEEDSGTFEYNHSATGPYLDTPYADFSPHNILSFISPEFLFFKSKFKSGDYLRFENYVLPITGLDTNPYGAFNQTVTDPGIDYIRIRQKYDYPVEDQVNLPIQNIGYVGRGASLSLTSLTSEYSGFTYNNEAASNIDNGGPKYIISLDNNIYLADYLVTDNNSISYMTYRRNLAKQYGGNSYEERSINSYISTSSYQNSNQSATFEVFGGDTYCNYFCYEFTQFADGNAEASSRAIYFVCESAFNVDYRHGNYFNKSRTAEPLGDQYLSEEYSYNPVFLQENNVIQYFKAKPFNAVTEDEQPYAIWVSEKKQNGEQLDSWVSFLPNNQIEVDGIHGPINHITSFKDKVYFYQDQAMGIVPIEQRAVTTDQDGIELVVGTGDVISQYGYISTNIGSFQHDAVIQSEDYIYNFDIRTKKMWRFSPGSKEPLSDIKGLNSFFHNSIYGTLLENTDAKTSLIPIGIHGAYEPRFNRVLFTFNTGSENYTISFNELLNSFESFYSFTPSLYLSTNRKLFSVTGEPLIGDRSKLYQHNLGDYGVFYDENAVDSTITYVINAQVPDTKEFNNLEWYSQCFNNLNQDIDNETFELLRVFNDHQTTGPILLQADQIRRRFRQWRHSIQRDLNSPEQAARIRNPWIFLELKKSNLNNNRFIMHDLNTYYLK